MQIVVLADELLKEELGKGPEGIIYVRNLEELSNFPEADAFIDLLFEASAERISILKTLLPKPVLVNSVTAILKEIDASFIRICGWPTFLKGDLIEASASSEKKGTAEKIFDGFGKKVEWVKDQPGFITPRVVSMIINEAFLALEEEVSSREEIDTAMKLGTNYPFGPFEWAEKIGREKIYELLQVLSREQKRYEPAKMLRPHRS